MSASIVGAQPFQPQQQQQERQQPTRSERISQFFSRTMAAVTENAQAAKPAVIVAGKTTAKVGGVFAAISAICLAIFTLLCAVLFY